MVRPALWMTMLAALALAAAGLARLDPLRMGRQPDGSFLVSSGQRVVEGSLAFPGRPIDLALHPSGEFYAILNKASILLGDAGRVRKAATYRLGNKANAGFRGIAWSPDGQTLFASTDQGHIQRFRLEDDRLVSAEPLIPRLNDRRGNPVPGGMALTKDGKRLFVATANFNAVVEFDLARNEPVREYLVENLPFEPRLTDDEKTLVVSNWGGRLPREDEETAKSDQLDILTDARGVASSGSVSLVDLATGEVRRVDVGLHPTAVAIAGRRAYVACAMSDEVAEIDIDAGRLVRSIPIQLEDLRVIGAMPNALAVRGDTLYVADGGDNAVAEIDLPSGKVRGFRPAGYFPTALVLANDGKSAFVLNTKGNGSVNRTINGNPGNAHDFQGTVTVLDLADDLKAATGVVAANNHWGRTPRRPPGPVYNGAIKHVLYIIKENRTYDEVFGDLPRGNGDPALCSLGETVMPNHRKLAREFTLFDNGYVSGTNSTEGHAWSTQALANEYLEHFYVGYSRTYPCEGEDPMSLSSGGALWDAAIKKGKTLRVWGEFCDETKARIEPRPKDWFELWDDRQKGGGKFKFAAETTVASLKPYINREVFYWPLLQSDQFRADVFIREYEEFSRQDKIPDLMILSLPCDHGEGTNPQYPTPRAMMADNDLALGRVVEAVSKSPQWKETCIFVVEDDAQSGPDHVDGHRTVFMAISPYNRRGTVDSTFYTQPNMIRSMEMILGLDPMNRFDALAEPMAACFGDTADPTPYKAVPSNVPLDERNPNGPNMTADERFWMRKTLELDWGHIDAPDPFWLNRINWFSLYKGKRAYPGRPGEKPGMHVEDDDDD